METSESYWRTGRLLSNWASALTVAAIIVFSFLVGANIFKDFWLTGILVALGTVCAFFGVMLGTVLSQLSRIEAEIYAHKDDHIAVSYALLKMNWIWIINYLTTLCSFFGLFALILGALSQVLLSSMFFAAGVVLMLIGLIFQVFFVSLLLDYYH